MSDKKSFVMYAEYGDLINKLEDEDAGQLIKAVFQYQLTGEISDLSPVADMLFSIIRIRLDQDNEKWENTKRSRAAAGAAGGLASGQSRSKTKQNEANEANASFASENEANEAVTVTVTVPVTDSVTECVPTDRGVGEGSADASPSKNTTTPRKIFKKPTLEEVIDYCEERHNRVDPERFYNYYESVGWRVGNKPMKDWRAAVRTWEKERTPQKAVSGDPPGVHFALEHKSSSTDNVTYFDDLFAEG